jgi:hypothetical protein
VYQASPTNIPERDNEFTIYPNPVSDYLFIDYPNQNSSNIYYRIYHPNGNIMDSGQAGSHIDLSTFAPGIYYLFIVLDQTIVTKKILKL